MKKLFLIWFVVIALIKLLDFIPLAFIAQNKSIFTAVILLYAPLVVALKARDRSIYDVFSGAKLRESIKIFCITGLVIGPLALVINHFYQGFLGNSYTGRPVPNMLEFMLYQFVVVAWPEEFFFRGFLQNKLNAVWPTYKNILGVNVGLALPVVSLVFALSHSIIAIQWWHILIFFPSLVFGWLFEKTKTIWASVLFHASCNIFAQCVFFAYGR